jgi:hypothetical protein
METDSRVVVARGWGRGDGSHGLMGTELQFYKLKLALEMDGGDDCTKNTDLILLNCSLKIAKCSWAQEIQPLVLATQEAEAESSLETRSSRPKVKM